MKLKLSVFIFLVVSTQIFFSSLVFSETAIPAGKFGYTFLEENGMLVTLFNPTYTLDHNGRTYPLSDYNWSEDSACTVFGFKPTREYFNKKLPHKGLTVSFNRYKQPIIRASDEYVHALFCARDIISAPPSTQYKDRINNPDGSFTIVEPRFLFEGIELLFSDLDRPDRPSGECKFFGGIDMVDKKVSLSPETPDLDTKNWMRWYSSWSDTYYFQMSLSLGSTLSYYRRIKEITCLPL